MLGWDWIMLGPGSSGLTPEQLRGWIDIAPPSDVIPGDEVERAALAICTPTAA